MVLIFSAINSNYSFVFIFLPLFLLLKDKITSSNCPLNKVIWLWKKQFKISFTVKDI